MPLRTERTRWHHGHDPIPALLIGRVAIQREHHRMGLGTRVLRDAFTRAADGAERSGTLGALLDARDERAYDFHATFGFVALRDGGWPRPMVLAMETVRQPQPA